MKVIYGISRFPRLKNSVVTLGVFDGVHRAHQLIISQAVKKAKEAKFKSVVITFWPIPAKILLHQDKPVLTSLEHRLKLIGELNPDYCLIVDFNKAFAKMPADNFVLRFLVKRLGMRHVYIGEDYKFGKKRQGSVEDLNKFSRDYNYKVHKIKALFINGVKVSSSLIRELVKEGKIRKAEILLGRGYSLIGRVVHGEKFAKALGFPTANLKPQHEVFPPDGIYAVKILFMDEVLNGICYIGCAPTFGKERRVEVHIFKFKKKIYHKIIEINFIKKIREDKIFSSVQALKHQIKLDVKKALEVLKT